MSSIKLPHSSGNSMSIAAPATNPASDLTLTLPTTIGTNGQYMKVDGSGNLSFGTVTSGTTRTIASADASSGSEIEFASLDADAYWHRILFFKVSTNGNTDFRLQAGTSSAYLTSSYKTSCGYLAGGSSNTVDGDSGWIRTDGLTNNADTEVWEINFMRSGTTNNWIVRGTATQASTNYYYWITSNFELSAALAKIKIYPPSNNFDAGNIYIESFK